MGKAKGLFTTEKEHREQLYRFYWGKKQIATLRITPLGSYFFDQNISLDFEELEYCYNIIKKIKKGDD